MIQASNEFLPNVKVEDLVLPFSKSPRTLNSHVWLASYDQIILKKFWTSKGHIFQTIWPNCVGFFATSHIWCPLSKYVITIYQKLTNQNGIFEVVWIISSRVKKWVLKITNSNHFYHLQMIRKHVLDVCQGPIRSCNTHTLQFWVEIQN